MPFKKLNCFPSGSWVVKNSLYILDISPWSDIGLDYCNYVSLEIRQIDSFHFIFLKIVLAFLISLPFHINFISFVYIYKLCISTKSLADTLIEIALNLYINLRRINTLLCWDFRNMNMMSFLFRSLIPFIGMLQFSRLQILRMFCQIYTKVFHFVLNSFKWYCI